MLTTLEWPVTLVLTMRIQIFGSQWAMVLRPFGPEWARILQVEKFAFYVYIHTKTNSSIDFYKLQARC